MFLRGLKNNNSAQVIGYLLKTNRLIFIVSGLTFLVYFFFERFKTGIISNYFDLNLLIVFSVITGFINFCFNDKAAENSTKKRPSSWHYVIYLLFAILIGVLIYQQLDSPGYVTVIITFFSIISLFSIFILTFNRKR